MTTPIADRPKKYVDRVMLLHPGIADECVRSLRPRLLAWLKDRPVFRNGHLKNSYAVCLTFRTLQWYRKNLKEAEDMTFKRMILNATDVWFHDPLEPELSE